MAYAEDPAYCEVCGERLVLKEQPEDGPRPWCPRCEAWRYPHFSVGVSMIVYHPDGERILTIDQYGKHGILVAGYVARGDDLESTVRREVREETGLELETVTYNASSFFSPSNTLMANFVCRARGSAVHPNEGEVDSARWVDAHEVLGAMPEGSLARWFVQRHLESRGCGKL